MLYERRAVAGQFEVPVARVPIGFDFLLFVETVVAVIAPSPLFLFFSKGSTLFAR